MLKDVHVFIEPFRSQHKKAGGVRLFFLDRYFRNAMSVFMFCHCRKDGQENQKTMVRRLKAHVPTKMSITRFVLKSVLSHTLCTSFQQGYKSLVQ